MKRRTIGWSIIALWMAVAMTACGPQQPSQGPQETSEAEPAAAAVETSTPAPPLAEEEEPETTPREDALVEIPPETIFSGSLAALGSLESYRYTSSFKFEGVEDGEIRSGSYEVVGAVIPPDRQHLTWIDLSEDRRFEIIRIGDAAWALEEDEWNDVPAIIADAMMQAVIVFGPMLSWEELYSVLPEHSVPAGEETVNGVPCLRYTSTYQGWGSRLGGELDDARGDVWIAEAGFPMKYRFEATGTGPDAERGVVKWTMTLSDVNGEFDISPPQEIVTF